MPRPRNTTTEAARLDWGRHGLSARSRRVVTAALEAMMADEDDGGALVAPDHATCARVVGEFSLAVGVGSSDVRTGFGLMAFALEWLPVLVVGKLARMSGLALEDRIAYLEALEKHRSGLLCMLFVAFKIPVCIIAFEEPALLAETGFDRADTVVRRRLPVQAASNVPVTATVAP